jgi:hypothetical protein
MSVHLVPFLTNHAPPVVSLSDDRPSASFEPVSPSRESDSMNNAPRTSELQHRPSPSPSGPRALTHFPSCPAHRPATARPWAILSWKASANGAAVEANFIIVPNDTIVELGYGDFATAGPPPIHIRSPRSRRPARVRPGTWRFVWRPCCRRVRTKRQTSSQAMPSHSTSGLTRCRPRRPSVWPCCFSDRGDQENCERVFAQETDVVEYPTRVLACPGVAKG